MAFPNVLRFKLLFPLTSDGLLLSGEVAAGRGVDPLSLESLAEDDIEYGPELQQKIAPDCCGGGDDDDDDDDDDDGSDDDDDNDYSCESSGDDDDDDDSSSSCGCPDDDDDDDSTD